MCGARIDAGTSLAVQVIRTRQGDGVRVKKRVSFLIEPDLLDALRSLKARTGISESEQIRQAIRMWLDSREWPSRHETRVRRHDD